MKRQRSMIRIISSTAVDINIKLDNKIPASMKGAALLITGSTGSSGNTVLNRFLTTDIGEIRILSQDGKEQDDMRHGYRSKYPEYVDKTKFYISNVRNISSIRPAMVGVNYIFYAAVLKQAPSCKFFPIKAVKADMLGTGNVLTTATEASMKTMVCSSTDKAAYPINAMGASETMTEKVVVARSRTSKDTKTCCTRYGNAMRSRGSVVPLWIEQICAGQQVTVTEPSMTRFIISLDEAVNLVLFAFEYRKSDDILVQKAPVCAIEIQAKAVMGLLRRKENNVKVTGTRHEEKMYGTLLTNEGCAHAVDMRKFYRVPCDNRGSNYDKYFKHGDVERNTLTEFNSNNTELLDVAAAKAKVTSLIYIQEILKGEEK